ncbi:DsbA family protein [Flavimarina sp. Hel_I_48]|uniref:DsbA family protein n=1 Tax=Flavimarina sp. Hel_I_48 TaxID=1392488 RepID=UPI0004DF42F2|nr:DsbA family protein [Flavimarina sp. Hel_I_48]
MKHLKYIVAALFFVLSFSGNAQTQEARLIYVMDPQCSWCYANTSNIEEIEKVLNGKMDVQLKAAGMWLGNEAPQGGVAFLSRISQHLPAMISRTGASVGTNYYDLASDASYTFSSLEPAAAIEQVGATNPDKKLLFAKMVEEALFKDGKRLDKLETYLGILKTLNIDVELFKKNWMSAENLANTRADFERAKKLVITFPTLVLQKGGKNEILGVGYFTKEEILPKIEAALNN